MGIRGFERGIPPVADPSDIPGADRIGEVGIPGAETNQLLFLGHPAEAADEVGDAGHS